MRDGLDTLLTELVTEAEERNRNNAQGMYHALSLIILECREPAPSIAFIKTCAERALKD